MAVKPKAKPAAKKKAAAKKEVPVITPEVSEEQEVIEEEFETGAEETEVNAPFAQIAGEPTFTVRVDNKRFDGRTLAQVHAIVEGMAGAVKKFTIEQE